MRRIYKSFLLIRFKWHESMHASETNRSLTTSLNSHKSTTFVSPLFLHRETKSRDEHSSDLFHLQLKSDWQFWLAKMIRTRHITTIWSFEYVLDIGYRLIHPRSKHPPIDLARYKWQKFFPQQNSTRHKGDLERTFWTTEDFHGCRCLSHNFDSRCAIVSVPAIQNGPFLESL